MHPGDVIITINGEPIASTGQLRARIRLERVGRRVEIERPRAGRTLKLRVMIGLESP